MALQTTTLKLSRTDLERLDQLVSLTGAHSRSEVVQKALAIYEAQRERSQDFVAEFKSRFDEDAWVSVELDENSDPLMRIDGRPQLDVYLPTQIVRFKDGTEVAEVFLGDLESSVRIYLGVLPVGRAGIPLSFPLKKLSFDMKPVATAWLEYATEGQT
jgi:hypothetical protein